MTRLTRTHAWLAFAAISLLLVSSANAQSTARIVRLSYVNGDVQMDRGQGAGLDRALLNLPVIQGSRIVTANGEAEVELEDGSTVRVAPSSDVTFPVLALRNGGGTDSVVLVTHGTAYIEFFHRDGAEMTLALPGRAAVQLRRSVRFKSGATIDAIHMQHYNSIVPRSHWEPQRPFQSYLRLLEQPLRLIQ